MIYRVAICLQRDLISNQCRSFTIFTVHGDQGLQTKKLLGCVIFVVTLPRDVVYMFWQIFLPFRYLRTVISRVCICGLPLELNNIVMLYIVSAMGLFKWFLVYSVGLKTFRNIRFYLLPQFCSILRLSFTLSQTFQRPC